MSGPCHAGEASVAPARLQQQRPPQGQGLPRSDGRLGRKVRPHHHAPLHGRGAHPQERQDELRRVRRQRSDGRDRPRDDEAAAQGDVHRPARRQVRPDHRRRGRLAVDPGIPGRAPASPSPAAAADAISGAAKARRRRASTGGRQPLPPARHAARRRPRSRRSPRRGAADPRQASEELALDIDAVERAAAAASTSSPPLRGSARSSAAAGEPLPREGSGGQVPRDLAPAARSTRAARAGPRRGAAGRRARRSGEGRARALAAAQRGERRYAPTRPASIFGQARPQQGKSIFGEDLISDKSLDEVILSYLAEDLDGDDEEVSRTRVAQKNASGTTFVARTRRTRAVGEGARASPQGTAAGVTVRRETAATIRTWLLHVSGTWDGQEGFGLFFGGDHLLDLHRVSGVGLVATSRSTRRSRFRLTLRRARSARAIGRRGMMPSHR